MAIESLSDLLAPVPEAEFAETLRRRELKVWRGANPARLAPLLDWPALVRMLGSGVFPPARVHMTRGGTEVHPAFYTHDGRIAADRVQQLLDAGASLIVSSLEGYLPAVDTFLSAVRRRTHDRVAAGVIVTTGTRGAIKRHFDPEDLLIVQLEGTKHWRIHPETVLHPVRHMRMPPAPEGSPITQTLHAGDVMLMPAGFWHHCENGPGRSIHFVLSFTPPSLQQAAERVWRRLLADDDGRAPLTRGERGTNSLDEAAIRSRLVEEISRMSLRDFFAEGD